MKVVGNKYRTQLHNERLPDGPLSPRHRSIVDAVQYCSSLADFASAPEHVQTSINVCDITLGTNEVAARFIIETGIARAERELQRIRQIYRVYGVEPFCPKPEPDPAPRGDFATRFDVLIAVQRQQSANGRVMVRAGDRKVVRVNRAYVIEDATTDVPQPENAP